MQIHGRVVRASQTQLREAEIAMIRDFAPWTHWLGLPFRHGLSDSRAKKALRRFGRGIAMQLDTGHFPIAWAAGPQADGKLHFHALLALPPKIFAPEVSLRAQWRGADPFTVERCDVRDFNPARAAIPYMLDHPEHDHGVVCARWASCRRGGCPYPAPW